MKLAFALCAALCFVAAASHEITGVPMLLAPLAETNLQQEVIGMLVFVWHAGTVLLFGMGVLFACAARAPANKAMGVVATAMSGALGLLAHGLALFYDPVLWGTPAPIVWTVIPLVGLAGCFAR